MLNLVPTVQILLEYGAEVVLKFNGKRILALAITAGTVCMNVLIKHIAKSEYLNFEVDEEDLQIIENN